MNILKQLKKAILWGMALFCLTLAFQSPSYAASLTGSWQLKSLGGSPPLENTTITAEFDNDFGGRLIGSGGCNRYFTGFTTNSGRITIGQIASTMMSCGQQIDEQESGYFQALESATSYQVRDENLQLTYGEDKSLEYVKAEQSNPRDNFREIDVEEFIADHQIKVTNPKAVAVQLFSRFQEEAVEGKRNSEDISVTTYPTMGTAVIVHTIEGLLDDSTDSIRDRIELERNQNKWEIVWVGSQSKCRRGSDLDWSSSICP